MSEVFRQLVWTNMSDPAANILACKQTAKQMALLLGTWVTLMSCVFGTSSEIQLLELATARLLGPCPVRWFSIDGWCFCRSALHFGHRVWLWRTYRMNYPPHVLNYCLKIHFRYLYLSMWALARVYVSVEARDVGSLSLSWS